jgi:hypothetical protein
VSITQRENEKKISDRCSACRRMRTYLACFLFRCCTTHTYDVICVFRACEVFDVRKKEEEEEREEKKELILCLEYLFHKNIKETNE